MGRSYVIFADDDEDDLELIIGFFKQHNPLVDVLEFKDGKEVLQFLLSQRAEEALPALIVMDNNMPRMNGKEALFAIRNHNAFKAVPVVIYSTSVNDRDEAFCRQYTASLMSKPNTVEAVNNVAKILAEFCSGGKNT